MVNHNMVVNLFLLQVTGNNTIELTELDLLNDFDSEQYDRAMSAIFNSDYMDEIEKKKPDFSSIIPPEYHESDDELLYKEIINDTNLHCEDDNFIMDVDYIENNLRRDENNRTENGDDNIQVTTILILSHSLYY